MNMLLLGSIKFSKDTPWWVPLAAIVIGLLLGLFLGWLA